MAFQVMGTETGVFEDDLERRNVASQFCKPGGVTTQDITSVRKGEQGLALDKVRF